MTRGELDAAFERPLLALSKGQVTAPDPVGAPPITSSSSTIARS